MKIKFEKRDCWIGLFWDSQLSHQKPITHIRYKFYLCIIPCLPIIWTTAWKPMFKDRNDDPEIKEENDLHRKRIESQAEYYRQKALREED